MSGKFDGHAYTSVFYLNLTHGVVTVTDLQNVADYIAAQWNTNYGPEVTGAVTLTAVDIRFIPTVGSELRYVGTYGYAGTNAGGNPDNVSSCSVIDFVISDYYRGGHPRQYVPGPPLTAISNGSDISGTYMSALVAAVNTFRNNLNAHTTTNISAIVMGTVRFASGGAWLVPPRFVAFTSVKAGKNLKMGAQRRRILS
jgi:hypothetical protein